MDNETAIKNYEKAGLLKEAEGFKAFKTLIYAHVKEHEEVIELNLNCIANPLEIDKVRYMAGQKAGLKAALNFIEKSEQLIEEIKSGTEKSDIRENTTVV